MSSIKATVVPDGPKVFRVMLGKHEVGVSKTDFDARFHVNAINDALDTARDEGYRVGANFVATGKMVLEAALASGDGSESAGLRDAELMRIAEDLRFHLLSEMSMDRHVSELDKDIFKVLKSVSAVKKSSTSGSADE